LKNFVTETLGDVPSDSLMGFETLQDEVPLAAMIHYLSLELTIAKIEQTPDQYRLTDITPVNSTPYSR
jgi:hypothetical protein